MQLVQPKIVTLAGLRYLLKLLKVQKMIPTINRICVIVSIKDNGTGIDSEIEPRLFTKFATKSESGLGLGLYISKSIIEAHGGKIWGENNQNESGTTFSFSLPGAAAAYADPSANGSL